ncbi:hypothetical protein ANCDUO_05886 [Ancylostoma duodenale]|uniref:Uncharacterized protein n=1 Tax=Ancylostoma duodenale TaxID=51022 RepID=A0A0C2D301_9BILA|nr:hypothetical protein ANCDUO_05886 [Ancylostoma duodenale]
MALCRIISQRIDGSSPRIVSRSSSFHVKPPSTSRNEELTRLLTTFEKERQRDKEAAETHMACLKESELQKSEREKEQLSQTIVELQAVTDRLTLENLRNEHQAKDQKELAEHRKKQHDQQVAAMEESIRALTERCSSLSNELNEKDNQLREKVKLLQEIENRNSQVQPEALLEKILNEYQLRRIEEEKRKEANETFNKKIVKYHEQLRIRGLLGHVGAPVKR